MRRAFFRSLGLAVPLVLAGCEPRPPSARPAVVAAAVLVEPRSVTIEAGGSRQLAAQVNDAVGQPIGGAPIAFSSTDPGIVRVTATGLASSPGSAGTARVVVTSGGQRAVVPVTVTPASAVRVQKTLGDAQTGIVGTELADPLSVRALDVYGNAVPGAPVLFSTPDGGAIAPAAAAADGAGVASAVWTLGARSGLQRAVSHVEGVPAGVETFTATAEAGAPAALAALPIPPEPPAAGATVPLRVRVVDGLGNARPGAPVAWTAAEGGGTVSPASSVADASGVAETTLATGPAAGKNLVAVRLADAKLPPVELEVVTVPGPAASVEFVAGARQSARAGTPVRVSPRVRVTDAHGNPVAAATVRFTVEGGGAVERETASTDARGEASPGRWTLGPAGRCVLGARAAGVETPASLTATSRRR